MKPWLEQKVFEFGTLDGSKYKFSKKPSLLILINGVNSEVPLEQLFLNGKAEFFPDECDVKGYSILQYFKPTQHGLVYEDLTLQFMDSESGTQLQMFRIRNPFIQMNDEKVPSDYFEKMIDILKEHHRAKVVSEPETEVATENVVTSEPQVILYENEKYNEEKVELVADGYEEFVSDNYRVLVKDGFQPIVVKITESDFNTIDEFEYKDNSIIFKDGEEPITIQIVQKTSEVINN